MLPGLPRLTTKGILSGTQMTASPTNPDLAPFSVGVAVLSDPELGFVHTLRSSGTVLPGLPVS